MGPPARLLKIDEPRAGPDKKAEGKETIIAQDECVSSEEKKKEAWKQEIDRRMSPGKRNSSPKKKTTPTWRVFFLNGEDSGLFQPVHKD